MSSAARTTAGSGLGTLVGVVAWTLLAVVVALGGAGLVSQLSHAPGGPQRQELSYTADAALKSRLDAAAATLQDVATNVDRMSAAAKAALGSIAAVDPTTLQSNLERGNGAAVLIASATRDLRTSLAGLPGDGPDASAVYSNETLVRRARILAAMDAALSLSESWSTVTARSLDAAKIAGAMNGHNQTIADATSLGRASRYADAVARIETAKIALEDIGALRDRIVTGGTVTVLDDWITLNQTFDDALETLYKQLNRVHGRNTLSVQAAYRDEQAAFANLPDNRAIVVTVAQIAQGGLNQAVLAIDEAQGRIEAALNGTPGS